MKVEVCTMFAADEPRIRATRGISDRSIVGCDPLVSNCLTTIQSLCFVF